MADLDFDDETLQEVSPPLEHDDESDGEGIAAPAKRRRTSHGGKASAKKPGTGTPQGKGEASKTCFISGCLEKKCGKHKTCTSHKKTVDAILYQAEKSGKKAEVERVLADPVMAAKAVMDFEAENPPGKFRKKLIDFAVWLKTYSSETAMKNREIVENYTFQDYSDEKTAAGWEAAAILMKWQALENDPSVERDEDGSLCLPKRKQRIRDQTKRITNSFIESSKNLKNLKAADADLLKEFTANSMAPHSHAFLHSKDASGAVAQAMLSEPVDVDAEDDPKGTKKPKRVDLASALPTVSEKELSALQRLKVLCRLRLRRQKLLSHGRGIEAR